MGGASNFQVVLPCALAGHLLVCPACWFAQLCRQYHHRKNMSESAPLIANARWLNHKGRQNSTTTLDNQMATIGKPVLTVNSAQRGMVVPSCRCGQISNVMMSLIFPRAQTGVAKAFLEFSGALSSVHVYTCGIQHTFSSAAFNQGFFTSTLFFHYFSTTFRPRD